MQGIGQGRPYFGVKILSILSWTFLNKNSAYSAVSLLFFPFSRRILFQMYLLFKRLTANAINCCENDVWQGESSIYLRLVPVRGEMDLEFSWLTTEGPLIHSRHVGVGLGRLGRSWLGCRELGQIGHHRTLIGARVNELCRSDQLKRGSCKHFYAKSVFLRLMTRSVIN